jgi:hypothetical protein
LYRVLLDNERFKVHIGRFFRAITLLGITPTHWNHSNTVLLPKERGATCPLDKTRPVSLTNQMRRYYESVLLSHLKVQSWAKHHRFQAGFRDRLSTTPHLLMAHDAGASTRALHSRLHVFLDIQKAFDRISHRSLVADMRAKGFDAHAQSLIAQLMMKNCSSALVINQEISGTFARQRGVFQGSLIAPFLFNTAMDMLLQAVEDETKDIKAPLLPLLAYADDLKIQLPGYRPAETQQVLDTCARWAADHGLAFGLGKCGVISDRTDHNLTIAEQPITQVETYTYLGVQMGLNGADWLRHFQRAFQSANGLLLAMISQATPHWSEGIIAILYKTFVLPIWGYGRSMYALQKSYRMVNAATVSLIQDMMDHHHKLALKFIYGKDLKRDDLCRDLAFLPTPAEQMELLDLPLLTNQLHRLHPESAWHRALTELKWPEQDSTLTSLAQTNILYHQWRAYTPPEGTAKPSINKFLKNKLLNRWRGRKAGSSAKLIHYISKSCRTSSGRMDRLLLIKHPATRKRAIAWRLNKFKPSAKCHRCGLDNAHRTHWTGCIRQHKPHVLSRAQWISYDHAAEQHAAKGRQLSLLDWLLNTRRYTKFKWVTAYIHQATTPPTPDQALPEAPLPPSPRRYFHLASRGP